eukprot:scaffold748_cov329-Pavlova_lutheri.AAC.25
MARRRRAAYAIARARLTLDLTPSKFTNEGAPPLPRPVGVRVWGLGSSPSFGVGGGGSPRRRWDGGEHWGGGVGTDPGIGRVRKGREKGDRNQTHPGQKDKRTKGQGAKPRQTEWRDPSWTGSRPRFFPSGTRHRSTVGGRET